MQFQREDIFHPCCGFNLQSVVPRLLPGLQFLCLKLCIVFLTFGIFENLESLQQNKIEDPATYYVRVYCWIGYGLYILVMEGLLLFLWRGIHSKNLALIKVWLVGNGPVSVICLLGMFTFSLIRFQGTFRHLFAMGVFYCVVQFYLWYVVHVFCKEIEIGQASSMRTLTDAEMKGFNDGLPQPPFRIQDLDAPTLSLLNKIEYLRYCKENFEIQGDELTVDKSNPLGSGNYGTVYKGVLSRNGSTVVVAVKTVDPDNTDVHCFKSLLLELKVMSYLGKHPNVVALLGASTTGIRDRNLLLISECCSLGNLRMFLVGHRGLFCNLMSKDGSLQHLSAKTQLIEASLLEETISTQDLIQWCCEIVDGMEYLGSMKVVHADLSARNVFLTDQKIVKLGDFGLARQLYNYSVYVKTQKTPLPWRWLSLEALTDSHFSSSSDVWAFAITLHEIFSLGEIPYPGQNFCLEFVIDLKAGLRPSRPLFAPQLIWDIMEQCWKADPKDRPTFTEIKQLIHKSFGQIN